MNDKEWLLGAQIAAAVTIFLLLVACSTGTGLRIKSSVPYYGESNLHGILTFPDGDGPFPAVILMHGCSGLDYKSDRQGLTQHANFLTENGFSALILDSFTSRGKSGDKICGSKLELSKAVRYRQYDAINAMIFLRLNSKIQFENIFMMGQSNGGSVAVALAGGKATKDYDGDPNFRAIVAYYPWCGALPSRIEVPLLVLAAEKDDWTPPQKCINSYEQKWIKGAPFEVIVYDQALHSFDLPIRNQWYMGHKLGGNSNATKESRKEMLAWFQMHMR